MNKVTQDEKKTISIIIPVFNDWDSLEKLIFEIDTFLHNVVYGVSVFVINDASTISSNHLQVSNNKFNVIKSIEIINLARNVGHQRAIAIGLAYLEKNFQPTQIVIMDADGEDGPSDIPKMLLAQSKTEKMVFAKRGQRKEGIIFRFSYGIYRILFYLLTGKKISFGNFCVIPGNMLRQLVFLPEIWGHFASGVLRSGLPHHTLVVDRKIRYYGKSKMSFVNLVMHGLSAFSVYMDIISVRLILFTLFIIFCTFVSAVLLLYTRYLTELAIPGWATNVGFGLITILFQSFLLLLFLTFNILSSRNSQAYIPARYFEDYLLKVEVIYGEY